VVKLPNFCQFVESNAIRTTNLLVELIAVQLQVFFHAGNVCIVDIRLIQESECD
jgi:hypothetical protein